MEYERKAVTITWKIENVKYPKQLYSPAITINEIQGTKWKLGMNRRLSYGNIQYNLTIKRESEDDGPENIELLYLFSVNPLLEPLSTRKIVHSHKFKKDQTCKKILIEDRKIDKTPLPDTITVRCKIWKQRGSFLECEHFFALTRTRKELFEFKDVIQNLNDFNEDGKRTLKMTSSSTDVKPMTVNLLENRHYFSIRNVLNNGKIEIIAMDTQDEIPIWFGMFIIYSSGKRREIGICKRGLTLKSSIKIRLPQISKIIEVTNADPNLKNETLTLQCMLIAFPGIEYEMVERTEYKGESVVDVKEAGFSIAVESLTSREGIICDTKLQTATETFPAHIDVLSTHSPVFEAMFKTNMKEAIQKCVRIDDMDAKTVKNMLVFMYSDTLEELEWKDTMQLYFAADKYQVLSLKQKCTSLLEQSLDLSNCCVLLHLANLYQDKDLKGAVQNYINGHVKLVVDCDEWRHLEKNQPQLAIDYFRELCRNERLL